MIAKKDGVFSLETKHCGYYISQRGELAETLHFGSLVNHVLPFKVNASGLLMHIAADHYMMQGETDSYSAWGDCLMESGLRPKQAFTGTGYNQDVRMMPDYSARIYHLKAE